ncbi:unnamed protein product [Lactuca saligna]|uniref:BHLH domain-containing protein n=1 Tax=Lactuca saligna TaxID=75948 RepID=A0AA35Z8L2_LACSI|nr:unnamed protein product [Lactuca saligna]
MLAVSPSLFSATYGWPLEDLFAQNLQHDFHDISTEVETNSYHSLLDIRRDDQNQYDFTPDNSISSQGAVNCSVRDPMKLTKKLNHNANERDRRQKINNLYAFLRSVLPMSSDQKKKVSIPGTVSCALKYLPKLQTEVEALRRKKDRLLSCSDHLEIKNQCPKEATIQKICSVVVSVCVLDEKEVVIQLISSNDHLNKNTGIAFLSMVLEYLEEEEDGIFMLNATTSKCLGEERFLNTLYLQVQSDLQIEAEKLKEKICSLYQQSREVLL